MKLLPYRQVPIVINSFNRLHCLRRLVTWLLEAGYNNLTIIDNASTYPPLVEYLAGLKAGNEVRVGILSGNFGHVGLWRLNLLKALGIDSEFVYTDPDVIPADFCPKDVVGHLQELLRQDPYFAKAGLGLRLDDIPDSYRFKSTCIAQERQYWRRPAAPGVFFAPIDTTFALYRPHGFHGIDQPNLRTSWPYLASHDGWYLDSANPTEEDRFYATVAQKAVSNWSVSELPGWIAEDARKAAESQACVLNLGCGRDPFAGYVNLDKVAGPGVDVVFNLEECAHRALPFEDGRFDGIYACHILDRIGDPVALMRELRRVAKTNAKMVLRLPHGASDRAFAEPDQIHRFFEGSFAVYGDRCGWETQRITFVVSPAMEGLAEADILHQVRTLRNCVGDMVICMKALPPGLAPAKPPPPEIAFTPLDKEAAFARVGGP